MSFGNGFWMAGEYTKCHQRPSTWRVIPALALAALLPGAAASAATPLFRNTAISPGTSPKSVVIADMDGDARPDLVSANCGSGDVSVLLGEGDGTFKDPIRTPAGSCPNALVAGDFNLDGKPDLALSADPNLILVLMGRGDGQFDLPVEYMAGAAHASLVSANFNNDAFPDLAATDASGSVSVLLGHGDGGFTAGGSFPTGSDPGWLSIGDFNHDGHPDLAVSNSGSGDVSVLQGNGDGTFAPENRLLTDLFQLNLAVADLNGDRNDDLLISDIILGAGMFPGNGDGSFGAFHPIDLTNPGLDLYVSDLNGDGIPDITSSDAISTGTLHVHLGQSDGTFQFAGTLGTGDQYSYFSGSHGVLATGDLNADGKVDLVTADELSDTLSILIGDGQGGFGERFFMPLVELGSGNPGPADLLSGDFNGDARRDLIVKVTESGGASYSVWEFFGQGDGSFAAFGYFPFYASPIAFATADFNRDGNLDLAVSFSFTPTLAFLGRGNGIFDNAPQSPLLTGPRSILTGDFDEDGWMDLAMPCPGCRTIDTNEPLVAMFPGKGDGSFGYGPAATVYQDPRDIAVADFNGDGKLDLAVTTENITGVSLLFGNGDMSFSEQPPTALDEVPVDLATGDFDNDGSTDLAVILETAGKLVILFNNREGSLTPVSHDVGAAPRAIRLEDVNADSNLDVVILYKNSNLISVYPGTGYGALGPPQRYLGGAEPRSFVTGDFNEDGRLDLAIANHSGQDVSILLNQGPFPVCRDEDADGYGSPGVGSCLHGKAPDCDDASAMVFPGAVEICDGRDNDCDGHVDETFSDQDGDLDADCMDSCDLVWNPDQADGDGDGIGDACEDAALFTDANLSTSGFSSDRIDGRDLAVFADAFGTCPGDARFNAAAKLDHVPASAGPPKSCIGIVDFHLFMSQFAKVH